MYTWLGGTVREKVKHSQEQSEGEREREREKGREGEREGPGCFWVNVESQWSTFTAESKLFIGLSPARNCQLITTQTLHQFSVCVCVCVCVWTGFVCFNVLVHLFTSLSQSGRSFLCCLLFSLYRLRLYGVSVSLLNLVTSTSPDLLRQGGLKITGAAWKEHFPTAPLFSQPSFLLWSPVWHCDDLLWKFTAL